MIAACARSRPKQKAFPSIFQSVALLDRKREPNQNSRGKGPMATLKSLDTRNFGDFERLQWLEGTRLDAILGATSGSHKSVRSGVRHWMAFVGVYRVLRSMRGASVHVRSCADKYDPLLKRYFPPPLHLLLSWTTIFRSGDTLRNYLGYVKTGCMVFNKPVAVRCRCGACQVTTSSLVWF